MRRSFRAGRRVEFAKESTFVRRTTDSPTLKQARPTQMCVCVCKRLDQHRERIVSLAHENPKRRSREEATRDERADEWAAQMRDARRPE